ncbi:hypothetical protein WJX79_002752 [Trebouxia sp. C0005]
MGKVLTDKLFELRMDYKRNQIPSQLGGHYTVQKRDTFGQQLSQLGRRVTPYELIKYNYNIDPGQPDPSHWLQGSPNWKAEDEVCKRGLHPMLQAQLEAAVAAATAAQLELSCMD